MKRNETINISGVIFYLDEDAYQLLRDYLDQISNYFAHYEDSQEIIADIESRMAEHLLNKTGKGNNTVTFAMVEDLIRTMGKVEDFAAEENPEGNGSTANGNKTQEDPPFKGKKLYRDTRHKMIAGVAAGFANYFNINVTLLRVLMVLALFDFFFTFSISSFVVLTYILCWIFLPTSDQLAGKPEWKKLYRDIDHKTIGGVASGLAHYFDLDVVLVRIIFVGTIFFGGGGVLLYIILWIVTPPAKTITDKMRMRGEPVTLSNIDSKYKSGGGEKKEGSGE